jgi:hypothetical protein
MDRFILLAVCTWLTISVLFIGRDAWTAYRHQQDNSAKPTADIEARSMVDPSDNSSVGGALVDAAARGLDAVATDSEPFHATLQGLGQIIVGFFHHHR